MQRVFPGHSFSAWGRLRKVLKAGSGPVAPPSIRLLQSLLHTLSLSRTHTHKSSQHPLLGLTWQFCLIFDSERKTSTQIRLNGGKLLVFQTHLSSYKENCRSGTSWKDKMNMWTALTLALQLLLKMCLHVEAQALGECLFFFFWSVLSRFLCQLFKCHCIFFYLDYMVAAWDDKKIKKWKNIFLSFFLGLHKHT